MEYILEVQDFNIYLKEEKRKIPAVENMNFVIEKGKTLGVIGESGSGKSLTCSGVLGLLDPKHWEVHGRILLDSKELSIEDKGKMTRIRGNKMALIMQNPMSAFNPVITIEKHFQETLNKAGSEKISKKEVHKLASELLEQMRIRDPEAVLRSYAFQLSGGMLQRVMIALAVAVKPELLIADEPTTALDLSVQSEILKILKNLKEKYGTSIMIVSHDLAVISELSDHIAVMYGGSIVEKGMAQTILTKAEHPYTRALFASRPAFSKERLSTMPGQSPSLKDRVKGCQFVNRCSVSTDGCSSYQMGGCLANWHHEVSCMKYRKGAAMS